ncbi:MAG: hypothetical protein KGJ06_02365 [Pseudomonadota bacterium]|nr:hypothetical protein [Pseudomonadota bacterium]
MINTLLDPSLYSNSYYQLPAGTPKNATNSLLQAMSQAAPQDSSAGISDLVDLSPQAQSILNQMNSGSTAAPGLNPGSGFVLSPQQQQQISAILAKYKDAPFTQDTYNQIQNDLKAAGLSPDQLSLEDQAKKFDPTQVLVDALNGINSPTDNNLFGNSSEQANASSYMQQIVSQWRNISSTAGSAVTAAGGTASS